MVFNSSLITNVVVVEFEKKGLGMVVISKVGACYGPISDILTCCAGMDRVIDVT